jgi:hypothetical protein
MIIPSANRLSQVEEYYFSKKLAEVRQMIARGLPVINLAIGNPDLPPSPETIAALCETAAKDDVHGYQPYRGLPALRQAMAKYYKRTYGVVLQPDSEILPLMGSKEGIFHLSMAFLNPGDRVLVPNPGYLAYPAAARIAGASPLFYDLEETNNWLPDLNRLANMPLNDVKLMWVNYPHMPTGALADEAHFRELVAFCRAHHILLCHDNPYSRILNPNPQSLLQVQGAMDCAVELNSLSKSHNMAGWRVGMLCGAAEYIDAVVKVKSNIDSGQFLPIQQAAIAALNTGEEWLRRQNDIYLQRRQKVYQLLKQLDCRFAEGGAGMFVWAKLPDVAESAEKFVDDLLHHHHIFIAPGHIFGSNGERYVRVSLCAPASQMAEAIRRLASR